MKKTIQIFIIIAYVLSGMMMISSITYFEQNLLIWGFAYLIGGAASVAVNVLSHVKLKKAKRKKDLRLWGILSIIFSSVVVGILMLCISDEAFAEKTPNATLYGQQPYSPYGAPYGGQYPPYGQPYGRAPYGTPYPPYGNAQPYGNGQAPYGQQPYPPYGNATPYGNGQVPYGQQPYPPYGAPYGQPAPDTKPVADDAPVEDAPVKETDKNARGDNTNEIVSEEIKTETNASTFGNAPNGNDTPNPPPFGSGTPYGNVPPYSQTNPPYTQVPFGTQPNYPPYNQPPFGGVPYPPYGAPYGNMPPYGQMPFGSPYGNPNGVAAVRPEETPADDSVVKQDQTPAQEPDETSQKTPTVLPVEDVTAVPDADEAAQEASNDSSDIE